MICFKNYKEAREKLISSLEMVFKYNAVNSIGIIKEQSGYSFEIGCVSGEDCEVVNSRLSEKGTSLLDNYKYRIVKKTLVRNAKSGITEKNNDIGLTNQIVRPGMSVSHQDAAGLIGTISIFLQNQNTIYGMSCAHILDPRFSTADDENDNPIDFSGQEIIICHPGVRNYLSEKKKIGTLKQEFSLHDIDIALFQVDDDHKNSVSNKVLHFNAHPSSGKFEKLLMKVSKFGFNTKHTDGVVSVTDLYIRDKKWIPHIQINPVTGNDSTNADESKQKFVDKEDSGSLLIHHDRQKHHAIGVLTESYHVETKGENFFAGVAVPIRYIINLLNKKSSSTFKFLKT